MPPTQPAPIPLDSSNQESETTALSPGQAAEQWFDVAESATPTFLHVTIEQLGLDITAQLLGPGDEALASADSLFGDRGEEELIALLDQPGRYRVETRANKPEASGEIRLLTWEVRAAEPDDINTVAADRNQRLGRAYFDDDELTLAATHLRDALQMWERLGQTRQQADTLDDMARVLEKQGQPALALAHLEQAIDLLPAPITTHARLVLAHTLNRAGILRHRHANAPRRAIDSYFVPAAQTFESLEQVTTAAVVHENAGRAWRALGAFQEAIHAYDRALTLLLEPSARRIRIQLRKADALRSLHAHEESLEAGTRALDDASQLDDTARIARARLKLAHTQARIGHLDDAEANVRGAQPVLETHHYSYRIECLVALGDLHRRREQHEQAADAFEEALALAQANTDVDREATILIELANLDRLRGAPIEALTRLERAKRLAQSRNDAAQRASAQARAAETLRDLDRLADARDEIARALDVVEGIRASTLREGRRGGFYAFRQEYFDIALDIAVRRWQEQRSRSRLLETVFTHERRLARELRDGLARRASSPPQERVATPERVIEKRLVRLSINPDLDEDERARRITDLIGDLQETRDADRQPVETAIASAPRLDLDSLDGLVDTDTVLHVYALGPDQGLHWRIARSTPGDAVPPDESLSLTLTTLPMGRAAVTSRTRAWRAALQSPKPTDREQAVAMGRELTALLDLCPENDATAMSKPRRQVIVADGVLAEAPFAALPCAESGAGHNRPTTYLVEHVELVQAPSIEAIRALHAISDQRPTRLRPAAIFADPIYGPDDERLRGPTRGSRASTDGPQHPQYVQRALRRRGGTDFERLSESAREAEHLTNVLPMEGSLVALGSQAHRDVFAAQDWSRFGLLHLATHAIADLERPDLSSIVLSMRNVDGSATPGFLRAIELAGFDLDLDLVVLSGCDTAMGPVVRGEGMVGLGRQFLYAGATRVVATLWPVVDRHTADLMRHFYTFLWQDGLTPSQALQAAQRALLANEDTADPYYWAGFSFQGDWRRPGGW